MNDYCHLFFMHGKLKRSFVFHVIAQMGKYSDTVSFFIAFKRIRRITSIGDGSEHGLPMRGGNLE